MMSDEKQESRIKVEDLPPAERELTAEEQQQIQGGIDASAGTTFGGPIGGVIAKATTNILSGGFNVKDTAQTQEPAKYD
jgi:hypothetical protein